MTIEERLERIEDHLAKQDGDAFQYMQIAFIAFIGSIIVTGATLVLTGLTLSGGAALQLVCSGTGLMVIGIVIAIVFLEKSIKYKERKFKDNQSPTLKG